MIGVFDSGRGGLAAFAAVRSAMPYADIAYLADRKNAPYGTKSKSELISLVGRDIKRLSEIGARKILIACCTASSVHGELPREYRDISIPIIEPTAMAAVLASRGCITVFATEATVKSRAFSGAIKRACPRCRVYEIAAQNLVLLVERCASVASIANEVARLISKMPTDTDTVVLGCTHFSFAKEQFAALLGHDINVVDSALVGARCIINESRNNENGKILYT